MNDQFSSKLFFLYWYKLINKMYSKKQVKPKQVPPITQFTGYYEFLSIDYPCSVYYQGFLYASVSTAFQAARTNDMNIRRQISQAKSVEEFKKFVAEIQSAPDWANRRLNVMICLNRDKFKRNKELGLKLFATQTRLLINSYQKGGDAEAFWGVLMRNGQMQGLNTLGKILINLREEMRIGTDSKNWVNELNLEKDQDLWPEANLIVEKQGDQVDNLLLIKKNAFFLGSHELNDFRLEHGSISKSHACIYFSSDMEVILVDLNSTHGSVILREGVETKLQSLRPQSLQNGDVLRFGMSTRRYTLYFSYQQVQNRVKRKEQEARQQLDRIESLKKMEKEVQESQVKQSNNIKSLLDLKEYTCLYVENVNRNFSYNDIKEIFNQYSPVKRVRINVDKKTGRFMGSVLVYFDQRVKINAVLESIAKEPLKYQFRIVAVNNDDADRIIATFTRQEREQEKKQNLMAQNKKKAEEIALRRKREARKSSQSRSRSRRKSRSSSSGSRSSSSEWSKGREVVKKTFDK